MLGKGKEKAGVGRRTGEPTGQLSLNGGGDANANADADANANANSNANANASAKSAFMACSLFLVCCHYVCWVGLSAPELGNAGQLT